MPKSLISSALAALPAKAPAVQKALIEQLGNHVSRDEAKLFHKDLFIEMCESHWNIAKNRENNAPNLRIYCPITKSQKLRKTVIDVVCDDMAFVLDSIVAEINKNNLLIDLLIHPVFYAKYDKNNHLIDISKEDKDGYIRQSHVHIHIKNTVSEDSLENLEEGLLAVINDVSTVNQDWREMMEKLKDAKVELERSHVKKISALEINRYCDFLKYLYSNNFTFLGYREYEFVKDKKGDLQSKSVKGTGLGVLHDEIKPAYIDETEEGFPRHLQELRRSIAPVSVSKTNRQSTIHRPVPMDVIAIRTYDEDGNVTGEKLFIGLFTSVTYFRSVNDVPLLRDKVEEVVKLSGFMEQSHDRKALRHILEKYPRDELFQIEIKDLLDISLNILRLQERQRIALFMRPDSFGRYISCLVYIPRDRFDTPLRRKIGEILEEDLNGEISSFTTSLDDSVFARVMFVISIDQNNPPKYTPSDIEEKLQKTGQTWTERLAIALTKICNDDQKITEQTLKYGEAFPVPYTLNYSAKQAVFDIYKIEDVLKTERLQLDLYKPSNITSNQLKLKFYNPGKPLTLSDVLPILEHMGLRSISELPYEITPEGAQTQVWIHDFLLEAPENGESIRIENIKENFEELFSQIWYKNVESDSLNRLVINAKMTAAQIVILRAYVRYMKQIGYPFGRPYIEKALTENYSMSKHLFKLFDAALNPKSKAQIDKILKDIEKGLEDVDSLDQDRVLRTITGLIQATLRTNFYQTQSNGSPKPYLSLKMDSRSIDELPDPKPFKEIFVYSPRVEGIHLRGDKIARGGLRWSDRHEDFRTEVLGLMKAQMVKNSVIVPMGSKGGFVVKTPGLSRKEFMDEGIECYKTLIRGLLDITDNQKGDKVIPPKNVVRLDGDDPYLVVAADKGTAKFSDIANGLAQEYGFWLDDAFASGGSAGYDHKVMGITARGAWESVKLHFRQLNHNIQEKPFDVVGIGDMGGDVFGNGMLLSEHIRLLGAFNHLHIFCDPDPDTEVSYKERKRLFDGALGWDQYDTKKLSKGGRIYSRSHKTLELTPEIQARFDINKSKASPIELIRAMLKSRTDLLWFGGIGTYVKATNENDVDVGDKTNDALRLNAKELRAKVIGEGANLGITQLGRIEFENNGGKINTDFIDNSGGVDSSDHEVNIKIVLTNVMKDKNTKMNLKSRNKLLEDMTDEVASHVLRNNYQQAQAISLAEFQAPENLKSHKAFIQRLEREKDLNRKLEGLPSPEDIEFRLRTGKGLTRPELCVLLSYAKIGFTQEILASDAPDDPHMQNWLIEYFPHAMREKFKDEILNHRLHREIIATMIANSLINRMGPTFLKECMNKTGASASDTAKAYMIVRNVFGFRDIWKDIESLDNKIPAEVQLRAMRDINKLAEHAVTWFLTRKRDPLNISKDTANYAKGIAELQQNFTQLLPKDMKQQINQHIHSNLSTGMPRTLAEQIAAMPILASACDIVRLARDEMISLKTVAHIYYEAGETFGMEWLRNKARFLTTNDHWQNEAAEGLIQQLYSCQTGLTAYIIRETGSSSGDEKGAVKKWLAEHPTVKRQYSPLLNEIKQVGTIDLSMLVLAENRLRDLFGG